jgi:dolichol kinase
LLRKLIHLAITVVPVAGWWGSPTLALALAAVFAGASLALEVARRWWPWVNRLLWRFLPSVFREWEGRRVLGSTWFAVGLLATLILFGRDAGGTALLFLTWGDPAAELVGRRWGEAGQAKTLIGSVACLIVCLLAAGVGVGLGGLDPLSAVVGAVVATLAERWPLPPDDNVWMPVLGGAAIVAVQILLGG